MADQKHILPRLQLEQKKANSPAEYDRQTLYALRAFAKGEATEGQQRELFQWMVHSLCRFGEVSFSDADREANFIEGRRFVGWQLMAMLDPGATPITREHKEDD